MTKAEPCREASAVFCVLAPNPSVMTGPGTNSWLIMQEDKALCIDPGPDIESHLEHLLAILDDRQLTHILLTHMHPDHSPLASALARKTGAVIAGIPPEPADDHQDHSVAVDRIIADGDRILLDDLAVQCIHTPGHTDNHVCYLLENEGMLFTGDHIMQGSTVVIVPPWGNMQHYLQSLNKLKQYPVEVIAPGHGSLIETPFDEIDGLIGHRLKREAKVLAAVKALQCATIPALTARAYAEVDPVLHDWASLSLHAHLIKLEAEGMVRQFADGQWGI